MTTWEDVQRYVRSRYRLAAETPDSFKLAFEYHTGRLQSVVVSRFHALDREWIDIASACCRIDQMLAEVALKKSFEMAVGSICLDGDIYVVRHMVQLATLDLEELELPLHVVARTADDLEEQFAGTDLY